jgi:hypothetical protein
MSIMLNEKFWRDMRCLEGHALFGGQFKGKCQNCGHLGHKSFQCKNCAINNGGNTAIQLVVEFLFVLSQDRA